MATIEHCLYCFETLSAHLENRTPMTLSEVQQSWATYPKRFLSKSTLTAEDDDDEEDEDSEDEMDEEINDKNNPSSSTTALRNPSLQRITHSSPTSGISTPSSNTSSIPSNPTSISTTATTPSSSSISVASPPTSSPLFVTWNVLPPSNSHDPSPILRGCIGTFSSISLSSGLSSYALTSALHDTRFSPISLRELSTLSVTVTLLTEFEDCAHALDWDVGTHGIRISFISKGKRYGACYLPEVAVEQEWSREETVVSAMRKGGWGGRRERWREVGELEVVRFKGVPEKLDYVGFKEWRGWVESEGAK